MRFRDIAAFVLRHATFSDPPLVSPQFPHVPLGVYRWMAFGLGRAKVLGIIVRAISFQDFQAMWSLSTNITDRQTDGRHAVAIPRFAL